MYKRIFISLFMCLLLVACDDPHVNKEPQKPNTTSTTTTITHTEPPETSVPPVESIKITGTETNTYTDEQVAAFIEDDKTYVITLFDNILGAVNSEYRIAEINNSEDSEFIDCESLPNEYIYYYAYKGDYEVVHSISVQNRYSDTRTLRDMLNVHLQSYDIVPTVVNDYLVFKNIFSIEPSSILIGCTDTNLIIGVANHENTDFRIMHLIGESHEI